LKKSNNPWKPIFVFIFASILLLSCFTVLATDNLNLLPKNSNNAVGLNTLSSVETAGVPAKVVVTCTPPKILADNSYHYDVIKVELQDLYGNPAYAPEGGVGVSLSSSDPTVGTTSGSLIISEGETYTGTYFQSTSKPGQTTIEATATTTTVEGLPLVPSSAVMTTVGAKPYKVQVILAPNNVLADDTYYYYPVIVQLQDSSGNPAYAPFSIGVSLASSAPAIGTVPNYLTIWQGETFEATWFRSTSIQGETTITAEAAGLVGTNETMTTVAPGTDPETKLVVWLAPNKIQADSSSEYYPIVIEIQDGSGRPVSASSDITVSLSSSNETVGSVPDSLTISSGDEFGYQYFTSTYVPGDTIIMASAANLTSDSATMTTVGYTPTQLAIYIAPSIVFAHRETSYNAIVVQVQDGNGNPARAPQGGITAVMTSSNASIGDTDTTITIYEGETEEYTRFESTYRPGQTIITASSATLVSGSKVMKTVAPEPIKLGIDLALPKVLANSEYYDSIVRILLLDSNNNPAIAPYDIGVSLFSSNSRVGTIEAGATIYEGEIFTDAWFRSTATPGSTTIQATAIIEGVVKTVSATITTVSPTTNPPVSVKVASFPKILSNNYYYYFTVIYLVDIAGNPAEAPPEGIGISLSSSDRLVGEVPNSLTIYSSEIYSYSWFSSTYRPGTTTITASAVGVASGSSEATTGVWTPISKTYTFSNLGSLFYLSTIIVAGDAASAKEVMSVELISYALAQSGAQKPSVKTDGLITSSEYSNYNLIIVGYNNSKTTDKNVAWGVAVNQNEAWFNISAEGKSINLTKAEYPSKSIAIIYLKQDGTGQGGTRTVMLSWGYGWQGTYAANLIISEMIQYPRDEIADKHLLLLSWIDSNSDGFVQPSEIIIVSTT